MIDSDLEDFQDDCNDLLLKFYGIEANDSRLGVLSFIGSLLKKSFDLRPYKAVSAEAQGCDLERIDIAAYGVPSKAPLTMADQISTLMDIQTAIEYCEAVCDNEHQEEDSEEKTTYTLHDDSEFVVTKDQLQDLWAHKERAPGM